MIIKRNIRFPNTNRTITLTFRIICHLQVVADSLCVLYPWSIKIFYGLYFLFIVVTISNLLIKYKLCAFEFLSLGRGWIFDSSIENQLSRNYYVLRCYRKLGLWRFRRLYVQWLIAFSCNSCPKVLSCFLIVNN